jgi:RNA polymerase sigma factor (sigma-70 family)
VDHEQSLRLAEVNEEPVKALLDRLSSGNAGGAWREFLEYYSPLIMRMIRRFESDHGRVMDCFVYVSEQLSDNGFHRLLRFQPEGPARFPTWLSTVVANLCIDWRRLQHGRFRPTRSVAGLSELDQLVYRHIYVRGMPRDECLYALQEKFPDLTEKRLSEINARLFGLLTPRQRWQLSIRQAGVVSFDGGSAPEEDEPPLQFEEPGPGPEELSQIDQERASLAAAMARLPARERLLLRLRYEQSLTLEEVARLMQLPDPFRANRQIQAALSNLSELMKPKNAS